MTSQEPASSATAAMFLLLSSPNVLKFLQPIAGMNEQQLDAFLSKTFAGQEEADKTETQSEPASDDAAAAVDDEKKQEGIQPG